VNAAANRPILAEIEDRAAHLLAARRFESWGAQDEAGLEAWLAESLSHRVVFWRLEATLARTDRLAALQSRMSVEALPAKGRSRAALKIAAAALIAVFAGVSAVYFFSGDGSKVYSTPVGGHEILSMRDGSTIELNTNTIVRVAASQRVVTLEHGEAYFQIRHDAEHPFVLKTSGHVITDLGTKFLVRSAGKRLEVSLVEGMASIEATDRPSRRALLTPGDVVVAAGEKLEVAKRPSIAVEKELGWRHGVIVFDNTTLADAAAEFNRYNQTKLIVTDPEVGRMTIGATFPAHDVERFARAAQVLLGVRLSKSSNEIVITR
jgi:transmembrane sensor